MPKRLVSIFQRLSTATLFSTIGLGFTTLSSPAIPFKPPSPPKIAPRPAPSADPKPSNISDPKPIDIAVPTLTQEPEVKSKPNLDYERLQELMKAGDWAEVNRLNSLILLNLGDRADQGYLGAKDTAKLPCADLRLVDGLWNYYTGGRSTLTMQAKIWRNMSGKTARDAKKFEGRVGWHKSTLNPNPKAAQAGHMPLRPTGDGGGFDAFNGSWIPALSDRLETCGMIAKRPVLKPATAKAKPKISQAKHRATMSK